MRLSFVIPAYNEENYIRPCLESIQRELKGRNYDTEIIVVNNASTDNTRRVAEEFADVRVVDEMKKGLVQARSAGFLASSGDLIANIDADTRLTKGWIDKVFTEFSSDDRLVALSGPYIYYDLSWLTRAVVDFYYRIGYLIHLFNQHILGKGAMLQGGNFIVTRTALEKIGGFNMDLDFWGEDTDVAIRIQKVGKVKFSFKLPMLTSGRRLKGEGLIIAGVQYIINHFWTIIFKKPFTKDFKDIRN